MKNVWVNGCFDIIHSGHIDLFKYAKSLGGILIVGIDSDKRVRKLKGKDRPINNQNDRKKVLEALRFIDKVIIFDNEKELSDAILEHDINVMVIGEEYLLKDVVGEENVKDMVHYFPKVKGKSTTNIVEKLHKIKKELKK